MRNIQIVTWHMAAFKAFATPDTHGQCARSDCACAGSFLAGTDAQVAYVAYLALVCEGAARTGSPRRSSYAKRATRWKDCTVKCI
jgi:hypothetical protein